MSSKKEIQENQSTHTQAFAHKSQSIRARALSPPLSAPGLGRSLAALATCSPWEAGRNCHRSHNTGGGGERKTTHTHQTSQARDKKGGEKKKRAGFYAEEGALLSTHSSMGFYWRAAQRAANHRSGDKRATTRLSGAGHVESRQVRKGTSSCPPPPSQLAVC